MLDHEITDEELEAAVSALSDPARLAGAQDAIAHVAPQLQHVLNEALDAGGWFDSVHETALVKAASQEDPGERLAAVRTMMAEETRLGMLVGVAVGVELARELSKHPTDPDSEEN